jgi:hypothetical protein
VPTSVTACRQPPSNTWTPTPGVGSWSGCASDTRARRGRRCGAATCQAGGPPRRMGAPCSTPARSRSPATTTGERASRHHGQSLGNRWLTRGVNPWRAGCGESRTSGSAGGPGKRTGRKTSTAPRPDPTPWPCSPTPSWSSLERRPPSARAQRGTRRPDRRAQPAPVHRPRGPPPAGGPGVDSTGRAWLGAGLVTLAPTPSGPSTTRTLPATRTASAAGVLRGRVEG